MRYLHGMLATSIMALPLTMFALGPSACSEVGAVPPSTAPAAADGAAADGAAADGAAADGAGRDVPAAPDAPFAVVELFTSEGCSSCPPADKVLADIAADAEQGRTRVFPLAFHVDSWDRLGWPDPFADAAHTARQRAYAVALKSDSLYTPQMIVNGTAGFVGSDRDRAVREIKAAMGAPARAAVVLTVAAAAEPDALAVTYAVRALDGANAGALKGAVLNLALVERNLASEVRRGENGGRTLRHQNVVRAFQHVKLDSDRDGRAILKVPAAVNREFSAVIGYVQQATGGVISGAARVDPTPAAPPRPLQRPQ